MKIKYLLLTLSFTLPITPMLAMDAPRAGSEGNGGAAPAGFKWGKFAENCGEKIVVGAAGAVFTVAAQVLLKKWLDPNDPNASIISRDKALENTRQHIKDLLQIATTTDNKELAAECRKSAAFGEQLLAQGISFRNNAFSKLCGNNAPQNQSK